MEAGDARGVTTDFLNWVSTLLPKDKYQIFLQLFRFPIATNELTEEIFLALEKVFDGKDAYNEYNFLSPEFLDDWRDYKNSKAGLDEYWKTRALNFVRTNINGFMIVDTKVEQDTNRPEPYNYFAPTASVLDFDFYKEDGAIEWLFLPQGKNKLAVFDDESYRIFNVDDKGQIVGEPIVESPHDLGYCPVSFFWSDVLKAEVQALKKSPLSNQLSNLDWLLFFQTSKKHLDLYAPYPIYSGFEQDCSYENKDNGDYCENGFIKDIGGSYYIDRNGSTVKCPVCADKRLAGVGSFIEVPLPKRENDQADLRNPVQITTVDKDSLEYNVNEVARITKKIYSAVVGYGGDISMGKAYNEDQVKANTESRRNVLRAFKKNFETIQAWTEGTMCRLRYGENYVGCTIQYGSDWYLYTADELTNQYKAAKEAGATDYQLDLIQDQIIETENKGNTYAMARAEILKQLEPYRHQTRKEVLEMNSKNFGNMESIAIKLNFSNFVTQFERENTDIVEFGKALTFDKKIEIILTKFKEYARAENQGAASSGGES